MRHCLRVALSGGGCGGGGLRGGGLLINIYTPAPRAAVIGTTREWSGYR